MVVDVLAGTANGFHHGALLVQVGGIRICVTHLSPRDASHRLSEANEILKLERNREPHRGFILVGDLNTLSPLDEAEHNATGLPATLGRDVGLARKFLLKPAVVAAAAANAVARTAAAADAADDDDAAPAASTSFFGRIFGGAATAALWRRGGWLSSACETGARRRRAPESAGGHRNTAARAGDGQGQSG